ncbi:MAG: hypothetical protein ACOX2O_03180 [Bdellovibrionota bacterium]|jgi:hypothetical protein
MMKNGRKRALEGGNAMLGVLIGALIVGGLWFVMMFIFDSIRDNHSEKKRRNAAMREAKKPKAPTSRVVDRKPGGYTVKY